MKTKNIILIIAALPLIAGSALSQEAGSGNTMKCATSDGEITIQGNNVQLRDYDMKVESVERDGVMILADRDTKTTAILDARDPDGLYLAIYEGGAQMQVVAPREGMEFTGSPAVSSASAPASPDVDVVRELRVTYGTEAITAR
jgi:hypothetical protein